MTPVISPWVFYLMPVCESVREVAYWATGFCGIALFFLGVGCVAATVDGHDDLRESLMKVVKRIIPFFIIFTVLTCLIPTEETLTKMIVAQNVTVERVDMVSDTVVTVYNDIMNLFRDSGAGNG